MARGWESKSVEDQISAREAESQNSRAKPKASLQEVELRSRREGLLRARTRTIAALTAARDDQSRSHLHRTLADLDARLAEID